MMNVAIGNPEVNSWDGYFSTIQVWDGYRWKCKYCCGDYKNYNIIAARDGYKEDIRVCNCKGAKKNGLDIWDLKKIFGNPSIFGFEVINSPQEVKKFKLGNKINAK